MINASHFIDAVPAAFFGIVALWAAASRRHWFVRTAVLVAVITAPLLIPAHEVVIGAAVESLIVILGVKLAGHWRHRRERMDVAVPNPNWVARIGSDRCTRSHAPRGNEISITRS
jgi:hypothetical protein